MGHGDDPGGLGAVDGGEVVLEPLVLGVGLGVGVVSQGTEGAAVGDEGLALGGVLALALGITNEGPLRAEGEVGLAVERDEVREPVVERVPHIADAAGLIAGHAEAVLVGREVSIIISISVALLHHVTYLCEGGQL